MAEINHSERGHALLSPSSSERWMNCTPSARLAESAENKSSEFAKEGELAHELAQHLLELWDHGLYDPLFDDNMILPETISYSKYFSEEMVKNVNRYLEFVINEFHEINKTDGP